MNMNTTALARYGAVKVTTAGPGDLLVMLYDGLIRFMREAIDAMEKKDRARAGSRIGRALAILEHLLATLDRKHSPELCDRLQGIYLFCMPRLVLANLEQSTAKIADVIDILSPLRDAWATAVAELRAAPRGRPTGRSGTVPAIVAPVARGRVARDSRRGRR